MCASLRAHGKTQLSKLLKSVRELTVQEFCETYGANTEYFVQESRKRLASQPINTASKRHKTNEKVIHKWSKRKPKSFTLSFFLKKIEGRS